ncbi:MAG: hypothetical protein A2045_00220 [Rhodocyclales bacterium GWA2_65_20]|nr:MAG: hypothetical protein A2045_00220 [Rhodocyclales bacterium GWA2_65_20]
MQMDPDVYFNEWAFMAKADPEVFEQRREQCINQLLSQSGQHRQQLQALQARIDAQRKLANSPQEAVIAISGLMCKSLCDLACVLRNLSVDLKDMEPQFAAAGSAADLGNGNSAEGEVISLTSCRAYRCDRER